MNQPQPETIIIECSAQNASRTSDSYDEWEVAIPPIQLQQGDEIGVNQSFLEARGTSTEILEFSSKGLNQNNRQRIYFEYYASDDGTNDKNKGRDWMYWGQGDGTADNPALKETAKTYKPCKAIRYDHLLEESLINANGNEFKRTIEGQTYQTVKPTDLDPRVANEFSINYKEDPFVPGLFNSVNSSKEVRAVETAVPYVGRINTDATTNQDRLLTFTDNITNLDALEYWELTEHAVEGNVRLKTPFFTPNSNYLASVPVGQVIWINWIPKRRQMSCYDKGAQDHDIQYLNYQQYPEISARVAPICGHFLVTNNNVESVFIDKGREGNNVAREFGYDGQKCIETWLTLVTSGGTPNYASPNISKVNPLFRLTEYTTGVPRLYCNPWTTQSKINLLQAPANLPITDPCPVNMVIRNSPLYIGSNALNPTNPLSPGLTSAPMWRPDVGHFHYKTGDPKITELFPKTIGVAEPIPVYLGAFHKENLKQEAGVTTFQTANSLLPFNQLSLSSPCSIVDYWSINDYKPWGFNDTSPANISILHAITPSSTTISIRVSLPPDAFRRLVSPEGNVVAVGRGTNREELIMLGKMTFIGNDDGTTAQANPTRYDFEIVARNIGENFSGVGGDGALPNDGQFDPSNPILWCDPSEYTPDPGWTYDNILIATEGSPTRVEWWDWREAKTLQIELSLDFQTNFPKGLPITKNTSYWGNNEPIINYAKFPDTINDAVYYTPELKNIYNLGYQYFLYHNQVATDKSTLPCNLNNTGVPFLLDGINGFNRGIWRFPLIQSLFGNSEESTLLRGVIENPTLTEQVKNSSNSQNASTTAIAWTAKFNPHIPINDMNFDFEVSLGSIATDGNTTFERNFYIWTPDVKALKGPTTDSILYKWTNQGIYNYLGWIPLCNQIQLETSKDYLTPTDLSNFWTETLHKSQDIKTLYDGNTIPNSKNRGILQNSLLMPIYGSWGNYNYPKVNGLLNRDYYTFPMTNGYAIGSVCFIDGHEMPTDWTWTGANSGNNEGTRYKTQYIYPRSPNNLVHLYQADTAFPMPTYTDNRSVINTGGLYGTYQKFPTRNYLWLDAGVELYPIAPSGLSNNTVLSNPMPNGNNEISFDNLSYGAVRPNSGALPHGTPTSATARGEPQYSLAQLDKNDLFTIPADTDYPFKSQASQREDAIYRETDSYPITYYSDLFYTDYMKFSQYIGCDNMTLTYNTSVSAFEFQFLHQPFATSFAIVGGEGQGGDNAVRIFDNIPAQVNNWERYSGINVRNWASPVISRGQFTYSDIQFRPEFLEIKYPNGINPETDLDLVGDRFMNKLGFLRSQYNPRTGTMVKGTEGFGKTPLYNELYTYIPIGTTGSDTDIADAIINTSISGEDNPNSQAHGGLGQLIFYPSSADTTTNSIRHTGTPNTNTSIANGVRYDFSYQMFGQRGGLKTTNHNKAMGFPNIVGTPQVEDVLTFPRTLNPDGEQRSGYTIEIGSSPLRALTLPIKLTDGYYYILCPDLIDDPQFYITANNGSVIPAIAIVSKTYVSGDFYTTFQSPIKFYCKKAKVLTKIKVQIRNSSLGVPSNLGSNSSVIFSINRYSPKIDMPGLDIGSQQTLDYSVMDTKNSISKPSVQKTINDMNQLATSVLQPNPDEADYIGGLQARIDHYDLPNMDSTQRAEFFKTDQGKYLQNEIGNIKQLNDSLQREEVEPVDTLFQQTQQGSDRLLEAIKVSARNSMVGIGQTPSEIETESYEGTVVSGGATATDADKGMEGFRNIDSLLENPEVFNDPTYDTDGHQLFKKTKVKTAGKITLVRNEPVKVKGKVVTQKGAKKPSKLGPGMKDGEEVFFTKPRKRSVTKIPDATSDLSNIPRRKVSQSKIGTRVVGDRTPTVKSNFERAKEERDKVRPPP